MFARIQWHEPIKKKHTQSHITIQRESERERAGDGRNRGFRGPPASNKRCHSLPGLTSPTPSLTHRQTHTQGPTTRVHLPKDPHIPGHGSNIYYKTEECGVDGDGGRGMGLTQGPHVALGVEKMEEKYTE